MLIRNQSDSEHTREIELRFQFSREYPDAGAPIWGMLAQRVILNERIQTLRADLSGNQNVKASHLLRLLDIVESVNNS